MRKIINPSDFIFLTNCVHEKQNDIFFLSTVMSTKGIFFFLISPLSLCYNDKIAPRISHTISFDKRTIDENITFSRDNIK